MQLHVYMYIYIWMRVCIEYCIFVNMYDVSTQGVDERMINYIIIIIINQTNHYYN